MNTIILLHVKKEEICAEYLVTYWQKNVLISEARINVRHNLVECFHPLKQPWIRMNLVETLVQKQVLVDWFTCVVQFFSQYVISKLQKKNYNLKQLNIHLYYSFYQLHQFFIN